MKVGDKIKVIRFGEPCEKSLSKRDGTHEVGMSCYAIKDGVADLVGWYFGFTPRQAWLGTGIVAGFGSDGEPLVSGFIGRTISEARKIALLPSWADK